MIQKNTFRLWTILGIIVVLSFSFVVAGFPPVKTSVIAQTVPLESVWLADGTTLYRLDIRFDATSYSEPISALEWRIEFPSYMVFDSWSFPPEEDFFYGNIPIDPFTNLSWQVTSTSVAGRLLVDNVPDAPIGANGTAVQYWFTVSPNATIGVHSFSFGYADMLTIYDPNLKFCPNGLEICVGNVGSIENLPFWIINPLCPIDFDGDGSVGVKDLLILLGAWGPNEGHPADLDDSGDVGVKDLLMLLGSWGPCPEGLNGGSYGSEEAQQIPDEAKRILEDFFGEKEHNKIISKQ